MKKEITNPFTEGQEVICVSEDFPCFLATGEDKSPVGKQAPVHPKLGETIAIDEILGDYLRFIKYDTDESFMWWHHSRFRANDAIDDEAATESIVKKNVRLFNTLLQTTP